VNVNRRLQSEPPPGVEEQPSVPRPSGSGHLARTRGPLPHGRGAEGGGGWRRRSASSLALSIVVAFAASCGGGQTQGRAFDPRWYNDDGAAASAFQRSFQSTPVPLGADVAVGVTGKGQLVGAPLDGGAAWTFEHAIDDRPAIAGQAVVGLGAGELFALDARTGKLLWKRAAFGKLRGAGDDGITTVVSILPTTGRGSLVLAVARDGQVVRQIEDETAIGVPAVVDGVAFLPWQGQYVTAYDLHDGEERARVLLRSVTSRAFTAGGAVFFGEAAATRLDDQIGLASKDKASTVKLPERALPGNPRWMRPGTDTPSLAAAAFDQVKLYARPNAKGAPGVSGGRYAATYFRVALGLDARSGAIAWAHAHGAEILGGAAYEGGFALCDAAGKVALLDGASGAVAGEIALGKPVTFCAVQADGLTKSAPAKAPPLAEQLAAAASLPDAELVPVQKVLLQELVKIDDPLATRTLIELASSDRAAPPLIEAARAAVAARRTGADAMLEALAGRYDFLAGKTRPPPVGPLADALAAMKEPRAAPLLAAQLSEPANSPDDVRRAAAALLALAGPGEIAPLRGFFAQYRGLGEPDVDEDVVSAVVIVAQALIKLGARDAVAGAENDPFTSPALKPRLAAVLSGRPDPIKPRKAGEGAPGAAAAGER
jgi:outer membrane protein assembly factor BamB